MARKGKGKTKEPQRITGRNWLAVHAHQRKGGPMKNRKKQANKHACRGKVKR